MRKLPIAVITATMIMIGGCDMEKAHENQVERLEELANGLHLTSNETEVAKTLIRGFTNETGRPIVHSRYLSQAVCYAGHVKMPDKYWKSHMLYLENYVEIDQDYYGWFEKNGVSGADAKAMGDIYLEAFNDCKNLPMRVKILKKIKNQRAPK